MNNSRHGQSLVEFALVLPIFLIIVLGLVDIGRGVFMANSLTNAAREGGRLAAVNQDKPLVRQRVLGQTQVATPTVTVNFFQPLTDPAADPSGECGLFDGPLDPVTGQGTDHVVSAPSVGCVAVVTTSAPFQPLTPIIGQLIGTLTLTSKNVTSVEFSCPDPIRAGFPFPTPDQCPRQP